MPINGLSSDETSDLTLAMLDAGERMEQRTGRVDKHSTGGVGDKMSIILAPALEPQVLQFQCLQAEALLTREHR